MPLSTASSPPPPSPLPALEAKNCSCVLFRHLAKTGGSTIQSILRRHEQIGGGSEFYYASHGTWVEIRPHEWNVLKREIQGDPDGFIRRHPRLLVSFHKQSASQFPPQFVQHYDHTTQVPRARDPAFRLWEDIEALREVYRKRGCAFTLATLLREPTSLYYSDYLYEGVPTRKTFPDFMGQDIQSAALLGWPFGWNSKRQLTDTHRNQTYAMLDKFDIVGLTERFDEALLLLARDGGLPWPMYRRMNGQAATFTNHARSSAAAIARAQKQRLLSTPGVREAALQLTTFDREVYAHYQSRFTSRLEAEGAGFASLVQQFKHNTSSGGPAATQLGFVGGRPPRDGFLVTSDFKCPNRLPMSGFFPTVDYGGCDVGLGSRGGPQRLDELKRYLPCDIANCTKIAADDLACKHVWSGELDDAAAIYGAGHPFGRAGHPDGRKVTKLCQIESAPDGFF